MKTTRVTRIELARLLEIDEGFIVELELHQIVVCDEDGCFDRYAIERARVCSGMHESFGVNMPGLEIALDLLERWHQERQRVLALAARLKDGRGHDEGDSDE